MTDSTTSPPHRFDGNAIETLVVALDQSRFAERALHAATLIATGLQLPIGVVHIVGHDSGRTEAETYLEDVRRRHPAIAWHQTITSATTPAAILRVTDQRHGVLCLASHGHTRLYDAVVGSVAAEISRYTTEPVLFTGHRYDPGARQTMERIVVPVDGTPESEAIIEWAGKWAVALSAPLHIFTVVEPAPKAVNPDTEPRRRFGPDGDEHAYITQVVARHQRPNLNINGKVLYDPISPASGLATALTFLPDAVIVTTTHAERGTDRLRHGSTAAALIQQSPVPVLITPMTAFLGPQAQPEETSEGI